MHLQEHRPGSTASRRSSNGFKSVAMPSLTEKPALFEHGRQREDDYPRSSVRTAARKTSRP